MSKPDKGDTTCVERQRRQKPMSLLYPKGEKERTA